MRIRAICVAGLFALGACGGGGSEDGETTGAGTVVPPPATDTTPPVVTLSGSANATVPFASVYVDPGASAEDDTDGPVNVTVSGTVDTDNPGNYTITYSATDAAGNSSSVERTVTVDAETRTLTISNIGKTEFSSSSDVVCEDQNAKCTVSFVAGATARIVATAPSGYEFVGWQNCDATPAPDTCEIDMTSDRAIFATSKSTIPLTVSPDVFELSENQINSIVSYDGTNGIVSFSPAANLSSLAANDIIVSMGSVSNPVVFAGRVSVLDTAPDGSLTVTLIDASLAEILGPGTLVVNSDNAIVSINKLDLAPGVTLKNDHETVSAATNQVFEFDLTGFVIYQKEDVSITVNGSVFIDPTYEFVIEKGEDGGFIPDIVAWRLLADSDVTTSLSVEIQGEIPTALDFEDEIPLSTPLTYDVPVAGLPILVTFESQLVLDVKAGLSVSLEPSISFGLESVTTGVQWTEQAGVDLIFDGGSNPDIRITSLDTFDEALEGSFGIDFALGPRASLKLYRLAGPFLKKQIFVRGKLVGAPGEDCPVYSSVDLGGRISSGGELDIIFKRFVYAFPETEVSIGFDTPLACEQIAEVPGPVAGLLVNNSETAQELRLIWNESPDNSNIAAYEILRRDPGSALFVRIGRTTDFTYYDAQLASDTEYCYFVRAIDGAGNKSPIPSESDGVCATTPSREYVTPPSAPILSPIEPDDNGSLSLTWSDESTSERAISYVVYDVTVSNEPVALARTELTSAQIGRLTPGREYCLIIVAVDERGNVSAQSNIECAVTTNPDQISEDSIWVDFTDKLVAAFDDFVTFDPGVPGDGITTATFALCSNCGQTLYVRETLTLGPQADALTIALYYSENEDRDLNRFSGFLRFDGASINCTWLPGTLFDYSGGLREYERAPAPAGIVGSAMILSRLEIDEAVRQNQAQRPECADIRAEDAYWSRFDIAFPVNDIDAASIGRGSNAYPDLP